MKIVVIVAIVAVLIGAGAVSILQWRRSAVLQREIIALPSELEETRPPGMAPASEPPLAEQLQAAAYNGDLVRLRALLDAHAELVNANTDNNFRNTALHFAAFKGQREAVAELIKRGAEVNERNKEGNTPLHDGILSGNQAVVLLLLQNGADIQLRNAAGKNAVDHALDRNRPEIAELIQRFAAGGKG